MILGVILKYSLEVRVTNNITDNHPVDGERCEQRVNLVVNDRLSELICLLYTSDAADE